MSELLLCP